MRMMDGVLEGWEFEILKVVDATKVIVYNIGDLDTAVPANNRPLPAGLYIVKDGVVYPVTKDTGTPANTVAIPVELSGVAGPVNITAGDLNVQLSDLGANFDAVRLGDGSGFYLEINADGSINVVDAAVATKLDSLLAKDFATSAKQDSALTALGLLSTAAKQDVAKVVLDNILTALGPISTAAKQDAAKAVLDNILAAFAPLSTSAKQDSLNLLLTETTSLSNNLGALNAAVTMSVANKTSAMIQVTGAFVATLSVEGTVDGATWVTLGGTLVTRINGAIGSTITTTGVYQFRCAGFVQVRVRVSAYTSGTAVVSVNMCNGGQVGVDTPVALVSTTYATSSTQLPASLGQKTMAASLPVVLASDQAAIPVTSTSTPSSVAGTITSVQAAVGLVAVRATVAGTAPNASRKKLMVKPSAANTGKIYIGPSSVTTANGMEIVGPDRLEFEFDAGDYYLISDTAAQVVEILEKV
jgi:hypothetical protein